MTEPANQRDLERLFDALDDEQEGDADEAKDLVSRLGINVAKWSEAIVAKIAAADKIDREVRFQIAASAFRNESRRYESQGAAVPMSIDDSRQLLRQLLKQIPPASAVTTSLHFHKFEEATVGELAEMIRAARFLLSQHDEK